MIDAGGGTGTLTVTTNPECAWTATSGAPWISLSPSSGQGSATVELRVTPNEGSTQRDGNITVNSEQVRVSQRAPCRFELAPATHRMAAAGGTGRVTVSTTSDCAWTATSDVTWIALATPVSGAGNGAVTFTVEPNGDNDRIGNIVIGGQRSTVMQAAVVAPPTPPTPGPTADAADAADATGPVAILQLHHFTGRSERRRSRRCRLGRRLYTSRLPLGCSEQCVVDHRDVGIERGWKRLGGVHGRRQHRRGAHWQPDHSRSRVHRHPGGLRVHPVEDARASACERGLCVRGRLAVDERMRVDGHQQQLVADYSVRIQRYRQRASDVPHWRERRRDADRLPHHSGTNLRSRTGGAITPRRRHYCGVVGAAPSP